MTTPEFINTDRHIQDNPLPGDAVPALPEHDEPQVVDATESREPEPVTTRQRNHQLILASQLRQYDLSHGAVAHETTTTITMLHSRGEFDAADELLDRTFPYGTSFYFSQLTRNARARAFGATTLAELERAEDFHDEIHEFLDTQRKPRNQAVDEGDRLWQQHVVGQVEILNDNDTFWPIAQKLGELAGLEAGVLYIEQGPNHEAMTKALAYQSLYELAAQHGLSIPTEMEQRATATIGEMPALVGPAQQLAKLIAKSKEPRRKYLPLV